MVGREYDSNLDILTASDQKINQVRTRTLDLSFNELLDMHGSRELIIRPEYQRLFRWSEGKQSRFIESLILEMPIPPIYVIEIEEGVYELIDGLQRISSYLHFRGQHPERLDPEKKPAYLLLSDCDIVKPLNGHTYDQLPQALKIRLKRSFVRVEVIRKESDRRLRYYMFKRLNTGGELLSEQEIRNCTIRLLDNRFNEFIESMSRNDDFSICISTISEDKKDEKFDQELVLRFFAFKNNRQTYRHDVGEFMTDYMDAVSDPDNGQEIFDYKSEEEVFNKTFSILNQALGTNAFSRANSQGTLIASFSSYHYEAFTLGMQPYLERILASGEIRMKLKEVLENIKRDPQFITLTTGGGKNYANPLRSRIGFVEDAIAKIL